MAACLATASRLGLTSTAAIDRDTSMTTTTVARSRGTFSCPSGRAQANVRAARLASDIATATCRRHCDWRGITAPSTAVLVNRMLLRPLSRIPIRYSSTNSGMTSRTHRRPGLANCGRLSRVTRPVDDVAVTW